MITNFFLGRGNDYRIVSYLCDNAFKDLITVIDVDNYHHQQQQQQQQYHRAVNVAQIISIISRITTVITNQ